MVLNDWKKHVISAIGRHRLSLLLMLVFAVLYGLVAYVNHYLFKTFALDLGVYTNALFDYGHLQLNDKGVFKPVAENLLSDHFDLYLPLFSPLGYILGEYTLQTLQIAFILFGSLGVYKLILLKSNSMILAIWAQLCLLLSFAVFAALSFDYHSNVPAVILVPWVFYFAEKQSVVRMAALVAFIWLAKESMSIFMAFVCLGLAFEYRRNKVVWKVSLGMAFASLVYFVFIVKFLMPALSNSGHYEHFKYGVLGDAYADIPGFILSEPVAFLKTLFYNHSGNPQFDGVKAETYAFLLVSGAWLTVFRPSFLLMLSPLLVMKMCYDDPAIWSIDTHYSIEFAPLLVIGSFYTLLNLNLGQVAKNTLALLLVMGSLTATLRYMDNTVYWHDYSRVRLYQKSHYVKNYNVALVHRLLNEIPEDAVVSAQTPFVPHLACRDKCYAFPIVKDAEYIIVSPSEEAMYPIVRYEMDKQIGDSLVTGRWIKIHSDTNLLVLRSQPLSH